MREFYNNWIKFKAPDTDICKIIIWDFLSIDNLYSLFYLENNWNYNKNWFK